METDKSYILKKGKLLEEGISKDDFDNHTHTVDDITDFPSIPTVPINIENGGTGATTASGARSALNAAYIWHTHTVDDITDFPSYYPSLPLSVAQGGTGATNAADARTNLGISGGGGGTTFSVLWTNPNSDNRPSTISNVSLSSYNLIIMIYRFDGHGASLVRGPLLSKMIYNPTKSGSVNMLLDGSETGSHTVEFTAGGEVYIGSITATLNFSSNNVTFGSEYWVYLSEDITDSGANSSYIIPQFIIGANI